MEKPRRKRKRRNILKVGFGVQNVKIILDIKNG